MLDSLAGADAGWTPTSYDLALRDLYAEDRFYVFSNSKLEQILF